MPRASRLLSALALVWFDSMVLRMIVVAAVVAGLVLALAGCTSAPPKTVVLTVNKDVYVPVPKALTAHCPIEEPNNYTVPEVVRVARVRKAALQKCNADKDAIRAIQGTDVPENQEDPRP